MVFKLLVGSFICSLIWYLSSLNRYEEGYPGDFFTGMFGLLGLPFILLGALIYRIKEKCKECNKGLSK